LRWPHGPVDSSCPYGGGKKDGYHASYKAILEVLDAGIGSIAAQKHQPLWFDENWMFTVAHALAISTERAFATCQNCPNPCSYTTFA
jgi:hypothetical protein